CAAGEWPEHVEVWIGAPSADVVQVAALRDDSVARLDSENATAVRRYAYRAADVGAERKGTEPACHGHGCAARGATRHAVDCPRVVHGAENGVVRLDVARPTWHVGLAEDDRPACFEARP